jgi:WD40 repeat protein
VCPVTINGQPRLASASSDGTIRIWDPATSQQTTAMESGQGWLTAVCPVIINGTTLIASAGLDSTIGIWDPAVSGCLLTIPVHSSAYAVAWIDGALAVGRRAGVLVIDLNSGIL